MRTIRHLLPLALVLLGLPAWSTDTPVQRTQAFRVGKARPRDRSTQAARPAPVEGQTSAPAGRSQPYRPGKPGEGAPKG